jgi:tetratricopeptide (TPR) repeat protein
VSWWVRSEDSIPPLSVGFRDAAPRRSSALRAELAVLEARARAHEAKGEIDLAHACWAELARGYLFRRSRHDSAIRCARHALKLKDDPVLRDELAAWLEGIGESSEAAGVLALAQEPQTSADRVRHHRRVASLCWRSGQTESSARALAEIARIDVESTEPLEWLAALHTNAPEVVSTERAVLAQLEAARRHSHHGARLLAFEAELRAFEIDPGSAIATEQLAISLTRLGRGEAAEDVWRECAKLAHDRSLYRQQIDKALSREEHDRALSAGLDALDDMVLEIDAANSASEYAINPTGPTPNTFDGILARARLFGWLAARFEIALSEDKSLRYSRSFVILTRLLATAMGRPELAVESLTRGLLIDPKSTELRRMFEAIAVDGEGSSLLLRSLVNAARVATSTDSKLWLANEFIEFKNKGLNAPSLVSWALQAKRGESLAGSIDSGTLAEWQARSAAEHAHWQTLLNESREKPQPERVADLRRVAAAMALDPDAFESWRDVLTDWLNLEEGAAQALVYLAQLVDALARKGVAEDVTTQWRAALDLLVKQGGERGCLAVAGFWLSKGRPNEALAAVRGILEKADPSQRLLGWVVTLARRLVDKRLCADSMALLAKTTESAMGAVLLAQAAEVYVELEEREAARGVVEAGLAVAPNSARLVDVEVILQNPDDPRCVAETLERALGIIPPRAHLALQLAEAHEKLGNLELALAWAQRAAALCPAAPELQSHVARLAVLARDADKMTDWLIGVIEVPMVMSLWLPTATTVLRALIEIDAPRAAETTRRLLAALGASDSSWRAVLLSCADAVSDAKLALEILERAVAAGADLPDVLRDIVRRRLSLGDFEAAFDASLRALKAGVPPAAVRGWVPNLLDGKSYEVPDTELAAAELDRELCRTDDNPAASIEATRRLAADRLVLASDETSALSLWSDLLQSEHSDVIDWVVDDLTQHLGLRSADSHLLQLCEGPAAPRHKSRSHTASAMLAAQLGDRERARLSLGHALSADPSNMKALFVAESLVEREAERTWLDGLYELVARSALGSYGERALRYRAAKIFERMGDFSRALNHACAALVALPSECTTMRLAAKLAREVGDAKLLVDAILTLVRRPQFVKESARWLDLAQRELLDRADFLPARVALLLQALALEPDASMVSQTTEAVLSLQGGFPDVYESLRQQLEQTLRAILDPIEGPSGARMALSVSHAAVRLLDLEFCCHAWVQAMRCDAAIDEYEGVEPMVAWLSAQPGKTRELLTDVLAVLEQPYVNIGIGALKAVGYLQYYVGDTDTQARLDALVTRTGESETFLEWMAEILERTAKGGSLPVIKQLVVLRIQQDRASDAVLLLRSIVAGHSRTRVAYDCAMQAVAILLKHDSLSSAQQWIQSVREFLTPVNAATIELELARMSGETLDLVRALAHRAYSDPGSPAEGVEFLIEATGLADRLGESEAALECAQSAAKWDPNHAGAQLKLASLIYRTRGPRGHESPEETAAMLRKLPVQLPVEEEELRTFLLAEILDAYPGLGSGTDELLRAQDKIGLRPLIALGLAERFDRAGDAARALTLFGDAVAGSLRGLRSLADVCIEGARVARSQGQLQLALGWLEMALSERNCPATATTQIEEIQRDLAANEEASRGQQGPEAGPQFAVTSAASSVAVTPTESPAPAVTSLRDSGIEEGLEIPLVRRRSDQPANASQPPAAIDQALISPEADPESVEKAIERAAFMVHHASPSYQTLTLLRRWLRRWPSSARLMEFVRDAAFVERDLPLSRAVEHARDVLLGMAERVEPPELGAQPIVPEAVRALLSRDIATSVTDALGLLWEGAEHLLQRDLTDYGVTGMDRVVLNSANPLGQAFSEVSARFGLLRTPLFHKRGAQRANATVALTVPASLLVDGELPRDFNELMGLIAGPLWVSQPEYALVTAASAADVKVTLSALRLAFGPPQRHPPSNLGQALRLAEKLWESMPSAAQRRLRDLCMESLDYDHALDFARRAKHRAGLFATGDLGWSIAQLSQVEGRDVMATIADPEVGENDPSAADLLRLATSAEYAAIRWQPSRGSERRIPILQR